MATTLPTFTPLEDSLFLTLYARARDYRRPHPILGDAEADQIVRTVDYDYDQLDIDTNLILNVALRAKKLDQVASDFLARHPDAIGLDLGAGLDTRAVRIDPPSTVDWYDVDLPAVAAARERLVPTATQPARHRRRRHREGLAGRHPHRPAGRDRRRWVDGVPHPGRACVALEPAHQPFPQRRDRLQQLHPLRDLGWPGTPPAPSPLPTSSSFPAWTTRANPKAGTPNCSWCGEIVLSREPEVAEFPPGWRHYHQLAAHSTTWSRTGTIVLHYRF